ncbi:unnamed protein product, partial [Menidia menidia]
AEARLAAKRAARAEAREIRMKELERQQKEKYYGLNTKPDDGADSKWGDIEQWMASYASSDLYSLNGVSSSRIVGSTFNGYQVCMGYRKPLSPDTETCSRIKNYIFYFPSQVEDREFLEKGSRAASALTAATLTSLGGTSSRRGSGETALTVDAEGSIREIKEIHELKDQIQDAETKYTQNLKEVKEALAEVEEKFRKAMVSNAQLDNEKNNLMYQVDTLKDSLMELEEMLSESRRECEEKAKEHEREKHAHSLLQFQFNEMKETLKQSEELLNEIRQLRMKQDAFVREISDLQETVEWKDKKIGALERQKEYTDPIRIERDELREEVVNLKDILKTKSDRVKYVDDEQKAEELNAAKPTEPDESCFHKEVLQDPVMEQVSKIRLRKLVDEREKMIEQIKKLKAQLEQKAQKNGTDGGCSPNGAIVENGNDPNLMDLQSKCTYA